MQNDSTHATYGYSWMLHVVEEHSAADSSKAGMCDELDTYLGIGLERTGDIVGWWGVSNPILP